MLKCFLAPVVVATFCGCNGTSTSPGTNQDAGGPTDAAVASAGGASSKNSGGSTALGGSASSSGGTGVLAAGGSLAAGGTGSGGSAIGATGGSTAAGGSGSTGACNFPQCLFDLYSPCQPSGSCVIQDDPTTHQTNACYGNGTKAISVINPTTFETTMTFMKGSSVCYSLDIVLTTPGSLTTYKNGAGSIVATSTFTTATQVTTVTCTGGQPITLNSACDQVTTIDPGCTAGICTQ